MRAPKSISPVFQRVLSPSLGRASGHEMAVAVIFTSASATVAALEKAGALAQQLNARVTLVMPQVVPFPLPLHSPPVLLDFSERRLREIAAASPIETTVQIFLCRDPLEFLTDALAPRSLVVIGGPKRWWPTREKRMIRRLRHAGHEVIFAETE